MFSYYILAMMLNSGTIDPAQLCGDMMVRTPKIVQTAGNLTSVEIRDCGGKAKWHKVWLPTYLLTHDYTVLPNAVVGEKK